MSDDLFADPEICQAVLMDYYRHPRCAGVCEPATHRAEANNPACGDVVKLSFHVEGGIILQARAAGAGCAVSQATASLLAERLERRRLAEAAEILRGLESFLTTGQTGDTGLLERLAALRMITANPARVRCALTAHEAAVSALVGTE